MVKDDKTSQDAENDEAKNEDELLDEWVSMASDEDGEDDVSENVVDDKILDQNEIDSLLGTDDGSAGKTGGVGFLLIIVLSAMSVFLFWKLFLIVLSV